MFGDLSTWVSDVISSIGYAGVAFLVALESVFPPIPSEVVLPFAGFYAGRGDASVPGMMLAATVGSVVGAWILYGLAAWIGPDRLRAFVVRRGRWFGVKEPDLDRAEAWFDRHGDPLVLFGRFIPLLRSFVSFAAGLAEMAFAKFVLFTVIGCAIWCTGLTLLGYSLGGTYDHVQKSFSYASYVIAFLVVVAVAFLIWHRYSTMRKERS